MLRHAADRIMISVSPFVARTITNDAATSKTLDDHSHVVRPAEMEWKKTRFSGCEVKGLLLDQQTGLVTDAGDVPSAQQINSSRQTAASPTYRVPTGTAFGATCSRISRASKTTRLL
jgi:hypothetical protein